MQKGLKILIIIIMTIMIKQTTCFVSWEFRSPPQAMVAHGEDMCQVSAHIWPGGVLEEFQACSFPITGGLLGAEEWVALGPIAQVHSGVQQGCLWRQSTFRRQSTFQRQSTFGLKHLWRQSSRGGRGVCWGGPCQDQAEWSCSYGSAMGTQ